MFKWFWTIFSLGAPVGWFLVMYSTKKLYEHYIIIQNRQIMELQSISLGVKEHHWIIKSRWAFGSFAVNEVNIYPFKWKLACADGGFLLCMQGGVFVCDFFSLFLIDLVRFLVWHRTKVSLEQTNKQTRKKKKGNSKNTSYASLNFIRLLRVVITPTVTSELAWISSEYFKSLFLRQ